MKVFWSWQSDVPDAVGKNFVKSALKDAVDEIGNELALTDADRPDIDHDTKGEAGLVDINATILKKIDECAAFVADATPVGKTDDGKLLLNPNVMIELGYAMKSRGTGRIVLVANKAYGAAPETMPFDLRHRRAPIFYNLPKGSSAEKIASERKKLTNNLVSALKLNLEEALKVRDADVIFPLHPSAQHDVAIWREAVPGIQHQDFFADGGKTRNWAVTQGTRSFLKICPASWSKRMPSRKEIEDLPPDLDLGAFGRWVHGDGGANKQGVVWVGVDSSDGATDRVHAVTQWFDKTGEIWGFTAHVTGEKDGTVRLSHLAILKYWAEFLPRALKLLRHLGADLPYRVEAGVTGLSGVNWGGTGSTEALEEAAIHTAESRDWGGAAQAAFVTAAYEELCDAFNRRRWTQAEVVDYVGADLFKQAPQPKSEGEGTE